MIFYVLGLSVLIHIILVCLVFTDQTGNLIASLARQLELELQPLQDGLKLLQKDFVEISVATQNRRSACKKRP